MSQSIQVSEVSPKDSRGLDRFIDVPWKIYNKKDHPKWVPPLRMAVKDSLDVVNNPFYQRAEIALFIAEKNGRPVGRIAAIENRAHNDYHQDKIGFYGFFECIDDQDVANLLFETASSWLKKRGRTSMRGPTSPSMNHEVGLLVRGQSQHPTIMTTWNPKYYESLHENAGLKGVKDLVAYILPAAGFDKVPQRVLDHAEQVRKDSKITFRDFDKKNFERDVQIAYDIYNSAWEDNWGFFPMSRDEFFHAAKDLKMVLDPRYAFVAEYEGQPAGFMIGLPDINQILRFNRNGRLFPTGALKLLLGRRFIKMVRVVTLGVKKEFRNKGIFSMFTHESYLRARKHKILAGEASWILEDNEAMNRPWQEIGAPLYRRWRIYEIPLS